MLSKRQEFFYFLFFVVWKGVRNRLLPVRPRIGEEPSGNLLLQACETREKRIFSKNERIGNSCRDSPDKTLDFL